MALTNAQIVSYVQGRLTLSANASTDADRTTYLTQANDAARVLTARGFDKTAEGAFGPNAQRANAMAQADSFIEQAAAASTQAERTKLLGWAAQWAGIVQAISWHDWLTNNPFPE